MAAERTIFTGVNTIRRLLWGLLLVVPCAGILAADTPAWTTNAPWSDPKFFPIAVWLQNPSRAAEYRDLGINTYIGLWRGPTEEQLAMLKKAGLHLICRQNSTALQHLDDGTIIGWMHNDEPDNAQAKPDGKGYGPPVLPEKIVEGYQKMRAADASRPVILNLGQGVAWDNYIGRGVRRNHPEDYPEYVKGCDIVSFDIYPAVHADKPIAGNLWYVAQGVERLRKWAVPSQGVWNCLECTHIENAEVKPTPQQVRAEAWMALIHGSRGLIYFVHQFKPVFREAALLDDAEMMRAVTALNHQITELAPVLNLPTAPDTMVKSENAEVPIATMAKRTADSLYVFAVGMRNGSTQATFALREVHGEHLVEVIGENRILNTKRGAFTDGFEPWSVHLYKVTLK